MKDYVVICPLEDVAVEAYTAHWKMVLTEEELREFKTLSPAEQEIWFENNGHFELTSYDLNAFTPMLDSIEILDEEE